VFLVWLYSARRNVEVYGARHQHYAKGWAIGGWFVPVANAVVPLRVVIDILRDSKPDPSRRDFAVLAAWWPLLAISTVADLLSARRNPIHGGISLNILGRVTEALAALALLYIVRRITAAQDTQELQLDAATVRVVAPER
jgi:hypothetical protein